MTKKQLVRLAALAQGAAVISLAGCNQTPSVTAPTTGDGPPINAPPAPSVSAASAADSASAADASSPVASGTPFRPRPPYMNAPPRPWPSGSGPQP